MKILFVLEHSGVSPLVPALELLHDRGHSITLAARRVKSAHSARELQNLADRCERIEYALLPSGPADALARATRDLRFGIDYLRYLEPRYRDTPKLRERAAANAPEWVQRAARRNPRALGRLLRAAERALRRRRTSSAIWQRSGPTCCSSRRSSTSARVRRTGCVPQSGAGSEPGSRSSAGTT